MILERVRTALATRSQNQCELCGSTTDLDAHLVAPRTGEEAADAVWACAECRTQLADPSAADLNHWRCLNDAIWSEEPAIQVTAWRMLQHLRGQGWPQELLDMVYLTPEVEEWAKAAVFEADTLVHKDAHGAVLQAGDTVTLIKDLNVKGANFTAKRGTAVRGIRLDADNPNHIEGRVNGQQIVILTQYVKKQG